MSVHHWTKRVASKDDAWATQVQLEAQGFQVCTVDSLPPGSSYPTHDVLHACSPPMADRFAWVLLHVSEEILRLRS